MYRVKTLGGNLKLDNTFESKKEAVKFVQRICEGLKSAKYVLYGEKVNIDSWEENDLPYFSVDTYSFTLIEDPKKK